MLHWTDFMALGCLYFLSAISARMDLPAWTRLQVHTAHCLLWLGIGAPACSAVGVEYGRGCEVLVIAGCALPRLGLHPRLLPQPPRPLPRPLPRSCADLPRTRSALVVCVCVCVCVLAQLPGGRRGGGLPAREAGELLTFPRCVATTTRA